MSKTQHKSAINSEGNKALISQYEANEAEYRRIESRIDGIRGYFLGADTSTQVDLLRKAYVYAALTSYTDVKYANEAYGYWLSSGDIREACEKAPYIPNERGDWIQHGLDHFETAVEPVRKAMQNREWRKAAEIAAETYDLKGLSTIKGPFMIALISGQTACIDRHARRFVEGNTDIDDAKEQYYSAVSALETADIDGCVFLIQWIAFDWQRRDKSADTGSVETHDLFYQSLDWC